MALKFDSGHGNFEDILEERRGKSDLRWAVREWKEVAVYKWKKEFIREDFIRKIVSSDRVKNAINHELSKGSLTRNEVVSNISEILEEMCHKQSISVIRKFAVPLAKIMKQIYDRIFVNSDGIEKMIKIIPDVPVVLLPTHRSYADFLLLSYLAYHYDLPLPVIAAGMDFMSMAVIGDMLKGAGAFYIKRSFVGDSLYWAIFQEFVEATVAESGQPLEFFLEGTRSRSGKTLPPKLGLLGCVLGGWFRGVVPDVAIIPVSISYERTLEELLFAYELLGVPKPKESTSGLFKAMRILKESFGDVRVHFGDAVLASDFLASRVDRHIHTVPAHAFALTPQMLSSCEAVAYHTCRQLQRNCAVSVWLMMCVVLLQHLWSKRGYGIARADLCQRVYDWARLLTWRGARVEAHSSLEDIDEKISRALRVHSNIIQQSINDIVVIQLKERADDGLPSAPTSDSVTHMVLQHYANQVLHWFLHPCLVLLASPGDQDDVFYRYLVLLDIFGLDFVSERTRDRIEFESAVKFLKEADALVVGPNGSFQPLRGAAEGPFVVSRSIRNLLKPFLLTYSAALQLIIDQVDWKSESAIVSALQAAVAKSVRETALYSALSLDTCRHCVKALIKLGALVVAKSDEGTVRLSTDRGIASKLQNILLHASGEHRGRFHSKL